MIGLSLAMTLGNRILNAASSPEWVGSSRYTADFANDRYWRGASIDQSEAISWQRSTAAYALSSTGYELFGVDEPRITDLGLTVEPTRSPGMRYSADQSNAAWALEAGLTRPSTAPGPIEGQNATHLVWASGNGRISQNRDNITNGQTVHVAALVKGNATARYATFRASWASAGASTNYNYVFDLVGKVVGFQGTGSSNARITEVITGWFLIEFDLLCGSTLTAQIIYLYVGNNNVTSNTFVAPSTALSWDVAYIDAITGAGPSTPIVSLATLTARGADVGVEHFGGSGTNYATHQFSSGEIQTFEAVAAGDYSVPTNLDEPIIRRTDWGPSPRGLVMMGDSLTAGTGASDSAHAYPAIAAAAFDPDRWFYNGGVGGNTSSQVLTRYLALDAEAKMQTLIIWVGRNNFGDEEQIISDIDAMIAEAGHDRYLVLNVLKASIDDAEFSIPSINATNAALASTYGSRCIDILGYLVSLGAPDGPHPDAVAFAGGYPPDDVSLNTGVHLNDLGYGYVGAFVAGAVKARRW